MGDKSKVYPSKHINLPHVNLRTRKMTTTRINIHIYQNHLYSLPEKAKPHQGGGKTEAVSP